MAKINANVVAAQVAEALLDNPNMVEDFKGRPYRSIEKISGMDNLSAGDMGGILDVLLSGANEGGGMLGSLTDVLTSGKKTEKGEQNVVGELIKKVVGTEGSSEIIGSIVSVLITNAVKNMVDNDDSPKKSSSTTKKSTSNTSTTKKSTTNKSTSTGRSTTTKPKTSSKKGDVGDIIGGIGELLDDSGIDVSELIGTLLTGNKK